MTSQSSSHTDGEPRPTLTWAAVPLAVFPLIALLTYDWHAITYLQSPAAPSSNWIGALGDGFAYYGYLVFGIGIWLIPALCIIAALCRLAGHRPLRLARLAWALAALTAVSSLCQAAQPYAPGIAALTRSANLAAAGGIVGYLLMTRTLQPLVGNFGATIVMASLLAVATVAMIGIRSITSAIVGMFRWAAEPDPKRQPTAAYQPPDACSDDLTASNEPPIDERTLRREEKQREKEARLAAKEAKRAARQAEKQAALDAKRKAEEDRQNAIDALYAARAAAQSERKSPPQEPENVAAPVKTTPPSRSTAPSTSEKPAESCPYVLPSVSLLNPLTKSSADHSDIGEMSEQLVNTLKLFGVDATVAYNVPGPVVTKYALELAPGTRYTAVTNISDNLMGALRAKSIRIEAPIPGEDRVGIEVPNRKPAGITFREVFESEEWRHFEAELPLLFGRRADGKVLLADLASMPHMLVAGATGQGKSVCLNSLISGLLMTRTPEQLKLIMVDPKCVEFTPYSNIPHLLVPVITDNRKVVFSLHWAVAEMEKRLKMFSRARVKNINDFNHRMSLTQTDMFGNDTEVGADMPRTVPYIVIIIDEAADLIGQCGKDVNPDIQRITQKARAAGIHLILATQRPDAKIITGAIKANIPGRVAFKTSSAVDSRTILDDNGAENLIGKGDMLFRGKDGLLIRAQGAWISDGEIANITSFIEQHTDTQFDETFATKLSRVKEASVGDPFADNEDDPDNQQKPVEETPPSREQVKAAANADDFRKAIECVINTHRASTSHFQRNLGWGYNHAAKILDMLTARGIVSPPQGMGPRTIVMDEAEMIAIMNEPSGDAAATTEETTNELDFTTEDKEEQP